MFFYSTSLCPKMRCLNKGKYLTTFIMLIFNLKTFTPKIRCLFCLWLLAIWLRTVKQERSTGIHFKSIDKHHKKILFTYSKSSDKYLDRKITVLSTLAVSIIIKEHLILSCHFFAVHSFFQAYEPSSSLPLSNQTNAKHFFRGYSVQQRCIAGSENRTRSQQPFEH